MIHKLIKLQQSRSSFTSSVELERALSDDRSLRSDIQMLTQNFLNRTLGGCSNCYFDAYLELIHLNINQAMQKQNCKFQIRRGVVLRDVVNYDFSLNMTQNNISDQLALYHLATNPDCRKYFDQLPDDIDQLIEEYNNPKTTDMPEGEQPESANTHTDQTPEGKISETDNNSQETTPGEQAEGETLSNQITDTAILPEKTVAKKNISKK